MGAAHSASEDKRAKTASAREEHQGVYARLRGLCRLYVFAGLCRERADASEAGGRRGNSRARAAAAIVLLAVAASVPAFAGEFWMTLLTQILIFGLLALSTDLLLGHAGLFSLCHASFFAVAAYTTAILQVRHGVGTLLAAPAGVLAGTLLAFVFAFAVRTRGVYFILITLAFGYIVWGVAYRWASFTGGDNGVTNVPFPALGSVRVTGATAYYYVVLAVVLLCALAYRVLVTSPFGLTLRGIKSSESRMRSLGYDVGRHLYVAFALSGLFAEHRRRALCLLQPLHQSRCRLVSGVGRGRADGDHRRHRHDHRAVPRFRHHPGAAQLGQRLLPLLYRRARHRVHRHRAVGAAGNHGLSRAPQDGRSRRGRMSAAAIEVDRLAKVFGGLRAVDDVSLAVTAGERRVLIGPNGAGKTTLFNCIAGTLRPSAGRVMMFGTDISRLAENRRTALGMGRTFQISNVCTDLTVAENLLLAMLGTDRRKWIMHRPMSAFRELHERAVDGLAKVGLDAPRRRAGEIPVLRRAAPARACARAQFQSQGAAAGRALRRARRRASGSGCRNW